MTERLIVESRAKVFTRYRNPFHYLLGERADRLPISYLAPLQAYLAPYTVRQNESHFVEQFARYIANSTEWKTVRFLTAFNREIYECCRQSAHEHGAAQPAEATLLRKSGSPRDLALLFIEGCRYLGSRRASSTVITKTMATRASAISTPGAKYICRGWAGAAMIPAKVWR